MRSLVPLIICAALTAGCQTSGETAKSAVRFDPALAAFINTNGRTTIEGHAFLQKKNGVVVNVAGELVRLVPVTPYSTDRFKTIYDGKKFRRGYNSDRIAAADPGYETFTRSTKSEANGKFSFEHVGPGRDYVATQLIYSGASVYDPEGGAFYDEVIVTGKEEGPVKVILSGN